MTTMKLIIFFITTIFLIISLILNTYLNKSMQELSDVDKCPFCYGMDFCDSDVYLRKNSIKAVFSNLFSMKNVYFAENDLVLKKGVSGVEWDEFDQGCGFRADIGAKKILDYLRFVDENSVRNFRICNGFNEFLDYLLRFKGNNVDVDDYYKNLWTILHTNVEPLIIQILSAENGWPVPNYYGACGRIIVEQDCGSNLNNFEKYKFLDRVYLAVQIIEAALNFTESHNDFRFYLTDVSPDNMAVDHNLKLRFIDLENVIITRKKGSKIHSSEVFDIENYAYSEIDICSSSKSDHNYFTICKLILSKNAPWPMMENGLLHTIPAHIRKKHPDIHEIIEQCIRPRKINRFVIIEKLLGKLRGILHQHNYLH